MGPTFCGLQTSVVSGISSAKKLRAIPMRRR